MLCFWLDCGHPSSYLGWRVSTRSLVYQLATSLGGHWQDRSVVESCLFLVAVALPLPLPGRDQALCLSPGGSSVLSSP